MKQHNISHAPWNRELNMVTQLIYSPPRAPDRGLITNDHTKHHHVKKRTLRNENGTDKLRGITITAMEPMTQRKKVSKL